jgi:hypothetical protein
MTNHVLVVTNAINAEQRSAIWEFMSQHTSEIIVSILTAGILSISAILWNYFGHPALSRFQRKREEKKRRDDIIQSFSSPRVSAGTHIIQNKEFVQIILDNQTSTPVVVRRVALVDDGKPIYGCWHDPMRMNMCDYTEIVNTGVRIAPHGFGVWHYTGPEFTSEVSPVVRTCEIEFEYTGNGDTIHVHTMHTPESMGETFQHMFEFWWRFIQKKHGKEPRQ